MAIRHRRIWLLGLTRRPAATPPSWSLDLGSPLAEAAVRIAEPFLRCSQPNGASPIRFGWRFAPIHPTTGNARCCACAAKGQVTALPTRQDTRTF
jgi:hypothetical protein